MLRQFAPRDVRDDANLFFVFEVSHAVWKPTGKGKNVGKRDAEAEEFATK